MGDKNDYRLPSMQLFTVPIKPLKVKTPVTDPPELEGKNPNPLNITYPHVNATSLLVIGDYTECIMTKGKARTHVRVRTGKLTETNLPTPDDILKNGYGGSFCKLSYPHFPDNVEFDAKLTTPELKGEFTSWGLRVLNHDETIRAQGCYVPDNYTAGMFVNKVSFL